MENFENIIGYNYIKKELNRIIDCINNREKYEKLGIKIPKNLLLHGVPGVGKTLFATNFINALNRKKYIIRKNMPDGKFVEYLKNQVNDAMNNEPAVVLLDDIDKFSNNDDSHVNSDEFIVIQSLIDDCKNKDVYFIATANRLREMPDSLLRAGRFDNRIRIKEPTLNDSAEIIKHYLKDKKVDKDINYLEIAKLLDGGSCALLETIINEAGLYAGYNDDELIRKNDIVRACLRVIYDAPLSDEEISKERLEVVAYHEAGHALVSEILEPGSVNLLTIDNYLSNKGGITSSTMNENYWYNISYMENRITVLLAG
jgi:cell division protease FtsH